MKAVRWRRASQMSVTTILCPAFHPGIVKGVATYAYELLSTSPYLAVVYVPIGRGPGILWPYHGARSARSGYRDRRGRRRQRPPLRSLSRPAVQYQPRLPNICRRYGLPGPSAGAPRHHLFWRRSCILGSAIPRSPMQYASTIQTRNDVAEGAARHLWLALCVSVNGTPANAPQ